MISSPKNKIRGGRWGGIFPPLLRTEYVRTTPREGAYQQNRRPHIQGQEGTSGREDDVSTEDQNPPPKRFQQPSRPRHRHHCLPRRPDITIIEPRPIGYSKHQRRNPSGSGIQIQSGGADELHPSPPVSYDPDSAAGGGGFGILRGGRHILAVAVSAVVILVPHQ